MYVNNKVNKRALEYIAHAVYAEKNSRRQRQQKKKNNRIHRATMDVLWNDMPYASNYIDICIMQ